MAENTIDFNPPFPEEVATELKNREGALSSTPNTDAFSKYWKYRKYCYVNIAVFEGRSATAITPETTLVIGDNQPPGGEFTTPSKGGLNMYTSEGEGNLKVRKPLPILSSVKITNQGGEDYTEAAIYEVEASFKVFTLDDLEKVEKSFFIIGGEMQVSFGWGGHPNRKDKVTYDVIKTNIYNFNFSIENDGSYNCNVKAISKNALFGKTIGGVEDAEAEADTEDADKKKAGVIDQLIRLHKTTFGIEADEDLTKIDITPGGRAGEGSLLNFAGVTVDLNDDGTIAYRQSLASKKSYNTKLDFYMGNIENGEILTFDDSIYVPYIRFGSFIEYINGYFANASSNDGTDPEIRFEFTDGIESKYPEIKGFASADPAKFVLFGDMAKYNSESGDSLDWSSIPNDPRNENNLENILLSINMIQEFYDELVTANDVAEAISPAITSLLGKIFNEIDINTGGLITPKAIPKNTEVSDAVEPETTEDEKPQIIYIMNRKTIVNATENFPTPYTFSAIGETSIVRSISLESDYDSDLLVLASTSAIKKGTSNTSKLQTLYPDNTGLTNTIGQRLEYEKEINQKDPLIKLENQKFSMGEDGYTDDRISGYRTAMNTYINQNFDKDENLKNGGYGELPLMLKLSVVIDGVQGIKFLSPITVDRLPKRFKQTDGNSKVSFSVTSVEHSFDGQGDWETTLGTVMRIR